MQEIRPRQRWRSDAEEVTVFHANSRIEIHYHQRGDAIPNNVESLSEQEFRVRFKFVADE